MDIVEPEPIVIRDGACEYRILKPIGTWGPKFNLTVYEAVILPEINNLPRVAIKMVSNTEEMDDYHYSAVDDITRITSFKVLPHTILPIKKHFYAPLDNVDYHCTVLLFDDQVTSLRSLILSRPTFAGGIPPSCIALALLRTLRGLSEVHATGACHDQITAGNIFFHRNEGTIKLAYAASVYERTVGDEPMQPIRFPAAAAHDHEASSSSNPNPDPDPDPDPNPIQGAPVNLMLEWGRAPEVEQSGDLGLDSYINNSNKSDIWLIGIVALELAYGKIQVYNRQEMMNIAWYISDNRKLPNTWEQLRTKAAGNEITEDSVSRFSESFGDFVGICLAIDPKRRARMYRLGRHDFLNNAESMTYFENVVVMGLSPPVGRAASERKRNYRMLSRDSREIRRDMLRRRRSNLAGDH